MRRKTFRGPARHARRTFDPNCRLMKLNNAKGQDQPMRVSILLQKCSSKIVLSDRPPVRQLGLPAVRLARRLRAVAATGLRGLAALLLRLRGRSQPEAVHDNYVDGRFFMMSLMYT